MPEAIVLAGGFGTRLRAVVADNPKPMAPVGGRPFLELLLDDLVRKGFTRVILSLGYMAEKVVAYFGTEHKGIELVHVIESQPLGTGGAIRLAMEQCGTDHVFVFNGDTYLDLEVQAVERQWVRDALPIIVGREVPDTSRYGRLQIESGRIVGFSEKGTSGPGVINAGCYVLKRDQLDRFAARIAFSLEQDYLSEAVHTEPFGVFLTSGLFIDIGVPEDYERAQVMLSDR
ncbi:dehydrogenase [Pseudomonas taiwanensis]|uniref:nucleotidyltransferase family protein n=1 Tax=Pseudomonas taiwanensis TaxID=470150 RepID=UPI0015C11DB5|nr:nucleotidyltransferase family protein [Pseudomonas taiwanensis]NWL76798.1 dehydrogenase [Pseudomonas taiwanensis]